MNTQDDGLPLVALGAGGLLAAVSLLDRSAPRDAAGSSRPGSQPARAGTWVFPVPDLGDRRPTISDGWGSRRTNADGSRRLHLGADIMFRRRSLADQVKTYPPGTPNGTEWHFMPDGVPVLAASDGVIALAEWTAIGFTVQIRHAAGWTTYYTHLAAMSVAVGQSVSAGQPIGVAGGSPRDRRRLVHLHFELWRGVTRRGATNPAPYLAAWERRAVASSTSLRNRGLIYRPIGNPGEPYPDWVRALKGASGVYVIRERTSKGKPVIVYVGQSGAGRLYETLTRHFQTWRRRKRFWTGGYTEGHDPGLVYERASVEVAVRLTAPEDAIEEEARMIDRLRPRDNLIGQPEPEDAPF